MDQTHSPKTISKPSSKEESAVKNIRNSSVDMLGNLLVNSILSTKSISTSSSQASQSLTNGKPPLSVQIITLNFKNFVSKSGPLFKLQNAVEDIFVWRNPPKTIACACLWAWLSIYPVFFLLIPNLIIIWILLSTHSQRYPHGMANDPKVDALSGKDVSDEPIEGSPDYISNMHHIQNLMGDISAGSDFVKSNILCYLDWSDPHHSLIILHLAVLSSIPLVLFGPMIPWRFVMLFGGESIFLATHPWTQAWIEQFKLNLEETLIHQQA